MQLLLSRVESSAEAAQSEGRQVLLTPELQIRESTKHLRQTVKFSMDA